MTTGSMDDLYGELAAMEAAQQQRQQQEHPNGRRDDDDAGASAGTDHSTYSNHAAVKAPQLKPAAYHGLAGDIIKAILPETDADPAALLATLLVYFGNACGRAPHAMVGQKRHGTNLFVALVGRTSGSRKGTSRACIEALFERVDSDWLSTRVLSGLASGQGAIYAVRDAQEETDKDGESVIIDEGVGDKRLMVTEEELCGPLRLMGSEGSILSAVLRQAWDGGDLATLTRHSPLHASNPHISVLGHSTAPELRKHLTDTEQVNGFANRFLWLHVARSKLLPDGGNPINWGDLVRRVHDALAFARRCTHPIRRDDAARALWHQVYPRLSRERPGLFGACTARAEAQALRLSLLYALLDCSDVVRPAHLEAALAMWSYCEESTRLIFGDSTGDKTADRLLAALRRAGSDGLTLSELSEELGRNVRSDRLHAALDLLAQLGLARSERLPGKGGGRRYYAI